LHQITQELERKGAGLAVLDQKDLDTTTRTGTLLFTLLGAIAAFERELILERAAAGRVKAKANGVRFGRPTTLDDAKQVKLRKEFDAWKGSKAELADKHGISRATLYRIAAKGAEGA
jgi:DNA invertase Pin-like site-specific DNA recombinase